MRLTENPQPTALETTPASPPGLTPSPLTVAAFVVALLALAGSLYLSLGLGLKACPLCFYQRTFVMAVVGVLGLGLLTNAGRVAALSVLALPSTIAALSVAGFHVYLELSGRLECPAGLFGLGTAPQQSLAVLSVLAVLVAVDGFCSRPVRGGWLLGVCLGVAFAVAAVRSSPPLPPAPSQPYETPPDTCRPPFAA